MGGGWMVVVDTERMGGGHRLTELYAVWDPDPTRAVALVLARAKVLDEKVTALHHVSDGVLACLEVPEGECRLVRAVS
jgi:hypothetical protein